MPDGVFVDDEAHGLRFELLPVPTNAEVLAIDLWTVRILSAATLAEVFAD